MSMQVNIALSSRISNTVAIYAMMLPYKQIFQLVIFRLNLPIKPLVLV